MFCNASIKLYSETVRQGSYKHIGMIIQAWLQRSPLNSFFKPTCAVKKLTDQVVDSTVTGEKATKLAMESSTIQSHKRLMQVNKKLALFDIQCAKFERIHQLPAAVPAVQFPVTGVVIHLCPPKKVHM